MESLSQTEEPFPTPPPPFRSDERWAERNMKIHHIHIPISLPPPPPSLTASPSAGCSIEAQSTLPVSAAAAPPAAPPAPLPPHSSPPRARFVSYEMDLFRSPGLVRCPACPDQITTQVIYRVGHYAWLMCFVFILFGLVLGCCLIPFFVSHFKDAYYFCPNCERVLHIERKTCC